MGPAIPFSITATGQRLGVEPLVYLRDVLRRLSLTPVEQLGDLVPDHWQATRYAELATRYPRPIPPPLFSGLQKRQAPGRVLRLTATDLPTIIPPLSCKVAA
jgi:hypothetical protein